jgi:O-antigen/teichoic acid export membrane protein
VRRLVPYGLRSYSADLLVGAATQIDKLIVVAVLTPSTLGLYVVATNLSRLVLLFAQSVTPVLFPRATAASGADALEMTSKAAAMTALVAGLLAVFLVALGPALLRMLYGAEFTVASFPFRILVLEACISSVILVLSQAFMALNRPVLVTVQYGIGAVVAITLLVVLAPRFGAAGAAIAMLMAAVSRLLASYIGFSRGLNVKAPRIWRGWQSTLELIKSTAAQVAKVKSAPRSS